MKFLSAVGLTCLLSFSFAPDTRLGELAPPPLPTSTEPTLTGIFSGDSWPAPQLEAEAFCSHPNPANGATDVPTHNFQISVVVNVPDGYELDVASLDGHVNFYEQTDAGLFEVPANYNDTGGGDAITLTPTGALKPSTTYVFHIEGIEAVRMGDATDRIPFRPFNSLVTTASEEDTNPPATLDGVAFTQVFGSELGAGTEDRFTSLVFGPDGKLYASTLGNVIKRWTVLPDGTLTELEALTIDLQGSPHPVTGIVPAEPRLIIGLAFAPESTADNLIAYVSHSALTLSNGPEWDGKVSRLSGPDLEVVEDILIHLPRSKKDHLTNSLAFGPDNDLFFLQGSNSAGGETDAQWGHREERLLSAAALRLDLSKLPATLPLSVYTSGDIAVINQAPATGMTLSDGTYNPYSVDSPLTIFATGIRNAYDLVFHSNGWTYIPTNGTAGNNTYSPILPASADYVSRDTSGIGIRRPNGTFFTDPTIPGVVGGETQKDWLFKTKGGSYHGHPNPYRGEFVLNHGGLPYSGLPGQLIPDYRDVEKYPADLPPDPNYREVAYDFAMNKSPNGVIEYQSDAFEGKLQGMLLVCRFSGQDDIIVLQPGNKSGDIIQAFEDVPGLQSLDDPLDITEHTPTGNLYVSQYDRGGGGHEKLVLMRVADPTLPSAEITATPQEEIFHATVGVAGAETDSATVLIANAGEVDLNISSVGINGQYATRFGFTGPRVLTLPPGASQEYQITYDPTRGNNDLGYQMAELVFESDGNLGALFRVGLHGLKTAGYGGDDEPTLQNVFNVLGVSTEVGWTTLTTSVEEASLGDEVTAELFQAAGPGAVTLRPIARFSSAEPLPFGYYTNEGGQVHGTELAVADGSLEESQTLFPTLASGATSFTPPAGPFGFYAYSDNAGRHTYTQPSLNGGGGRRVRIYPYRDRDGIPVGGSYVLCLDDENNGDYQDYVFLATNVEPVAAVPQVLAFTPDSLTYLVSAGGTSQSKRSLITTYAGTAGTSVNLAANQPWVILPVSATTGDSVSIGVDPSGLSQGTYQAVVTAEATDHTPASMQVVATVNQQQAFSTQINFQDNTFSPPAGYLADVGLPYGDRGGLVYGWINPYTKLPQDNTAAARGADRQVTDSSSDEDKRNRSFNMLDWGKQNPAVPRDWEIAVPNGIYLVELAAGDPSYVDSRHTIRAEGVVIIDDFVPTHSNYRKTGSAYVEVKDGKLTIDDNGAQGIGNSKLIYLSIQQIDPGTPSGALVRVENLTKTPFNNRSFPSDNFFTFHRMDYSYSYHGNELFTHEKNDVRIHNDGTTPLVITDLTTTSTKDFTVTGLTIPAGGLTVNPGDYVDATITFVSTGLPGRDLVTKKLVIASNADNGLTTHITLRGAFMRLPEGGNEITTQQAFDALGFITEMGRDANGYVIDRPGSDYPTDEEVNSGQMGDMILSRFWAQADPNVPIRMYQLVALHGPGYAPTEIRDANRSPIDGFVFRHGEAYHQAFLPRLTDTSPMIAGRAIDRITVPFQIMIAGYSTAGGSFDGSLSNEILGCRAYKAIDREGNVIPNEFILVQDYIESGCGPGTANCDFQDNIVYITNARPVDLPSAGTIPDFTVASSTPTNYRVDGYFDRGYAGNRLLFTAQLSSGGNLPSWMKLEGQYGTFTFNAPEAVVGQSFDITVTATDDNQRTLTASYRVTVTQGTGDPGNQPPQAVATANPASGTAPLQVTLSGTGSSDSDGTIVTYAWTWNGGSASGATAQATFAAGNYSVTLTVTDDDGAQATDVVNITASAPSGNQPPTAVAAASPESGTAPLTVQFDGSGSSDSDGNITSYAWNWNGGSATGAFPSATFSAGTYAVTLTVTDDDGAQATDVVTITASGPPPPGGTTSAWLEAECATVGSNWSTPSAAGASNGMYAEPTAGGAMNNPPDDLPENRIRFVVDGLVSGSYHLFARIQAPNGGSDSYWVRVNGGSWYKWYSGMVRGSGFSWNRYPAGTLALSTGTNTIDFAYREAGTLLDKIHLDQNADLPSGTGGSATNCNPNGDADGDGVADGDDNCPNYYNPDQSLPIFYADFDGDGYGDPGDSIMACPTPVNYVANKLDNCPDQYSTNLADTDGDGIGDVCDPDTPPAEDFVLEAECGVMGSGWQTRNSAQTSNGQYIAYVGSSHTAIPTTTDPSQEVTYTVSGVSAGTYHLYLRLNAPDPGRNSLWIKVDNGSWIKMWEEIGGAQLLTSGFEWRKVNHDGVDISFDLATGSHTITVANREAGTELDKLMLSQDTTWPAGEGPVAGNCGSPAALTEAASMEYTAVKPASVLTESDLTVFPNPTGNELNVRWLSAVRGSTTVIVSDLSGRQLLQRRMDKDGESLQMQIDTNGLPPGTYRLIVVTAGSRPQTTLFVKL